MSYRYILIVFFVFSIFISSNAQILKAPVSVPSPNAAAFGKYGQIPVSLYTGTPQIEVPVYTVKEGGISLPLSLSYHASGVKPEEHPGWVGLNWNLNYGGVITRVVKDLPDDDDEPWIVNGKLEMPGFAKQRQYLNKDHWSTELYIDSLCRYRYWPLDTEPDEFQFNFLGHSGRFYLDYKDGFKVRADEKITVELISNEALSPPFPVPPISRWAQLGRFPSSYRGFKITTEDGTQYIFGNDTNSIEYSMNFFSQNKDFWLANSWYLTKIIDSKSGKEITLIYERGSFVSQLYLSLLSREQKTSEIKPTNWFIFFASGGLSEAVVGDYNFLTPTCYSSTSGLGGYGPWDGKLISPVYIKEINAGYTKVNFYGSESNELKYRQEFYNIRKNYMQTKGLEPYDAFVFLYDKNSPDDRYPDVLNKLKWRKLDSIVVSNSVSNEIAKHFNFYYNNSPNERLMLQKFEDKPLKNDSNPGTYMFSYINSPDIDLPPYIENQTDHWGYYNGRYAFVDDHKNYYNLKETDIRYLEEGSLRRIVYPTGGATEFYYQPHTYSKEVDSVRSAPLINLSSDKHAGGLRIQKISSYDPVSNKRLEKEYFYVKNYTPQTGLTGRSSGILGSKARYYYDSYKTIDNLNANAAYEETIFSTQPIFAMSENSMGSHIGYTEVVEKFSDGSVIDYKFSNFDPIENLDPGHMDESYINTLQETRSPYEPFSSKSFERGKLLSKEVYNKTGALVSKDIYHYGPVYNDFSTPDHVRAIRAHIFGVCEGTAVPVYEGTSYKIYTYPYVLKSHLNYAYDQTNISKYIEKRTEFWYDNPSHLQISRTVENVGNGKSLTTYKTYPADYLSTQNADFIDSLNAAHIHNAVIEQVVYEDTNSQNVKILKGEVNLYQNNKKGLIKEKFLFESAAPVPLANFKFSNSETGELPVAGIKSQFSKSSLYKSRALFDYDNFNNLSQFTTDNYNKTSFIWGYNQTLPIAKAQNAEINKIAYTSFETDGEEGNWSYVNFGTSLYSSDAKTGNRSYYLLKQGVRKDITFPNLPIGKYIVGYWAKGSGSVKVGTLNFKPVENKWTYYEVEFNSVVDDLLVTGNGTNILIDELRLFPAGSLMTTYTYNPLIGVTSSSDVNSVTTYYQYDGLQRLKVNKIDNNVEERGTVVQKHLYHFGR